MKAVFVGLEIDSARVESLTRWEVETFDNPWVAMGFLAPGERLYVNTQDSEAHRTAILAAEAEGILVIEVEPLTDAGAMDDADMRTWLQVDRKQEPTFEVEIPSTPEFVEGEGEDTEEEVVGDEDSAGSIALLEQVRNARYDSRSDKPVGLNHKVQELGISVIDTMKRVQSGRAPYEPSDLGYLMVVTSAFGGGGKTTISFYAAQMMAKAMQNAQNEQMQVILIEGDYGNPKLQNRLGIPVGQDLSKLANFLDAVKDGEVPPSEVSTMAEQVMEDIVWEDPDTHVKVIACPYDKTVASPTALREAVKKAVLWAQRSMGWFVIVDADTIGLAEGVELDLVEMANRVLVIANARGSQSVSKRGLFRKQVETTFDANERAHIDDVVMLIRVFTLPVSKNGFGIPGNRIRIFFNQTSAEEVQQKVIEPGIFPAGMVVGNMPIIPEIERGWAADVAVNSEAAIAVGQEIAKMLRATTNSREVDQLIKLMGG